MKGYKKVDTGADIPLDRLNYEDTDVPLHQTEAGQR
jgi:hypothetical protein